MKLEEKQLADYMSDLSERSYCAGWMIDLEYVLWDAVVDAPRNYGFPAITNEHIDQLKELSDSCGGWIKFDDDKGESFIPMDEWLQIYGATRNLLPDWVNDG
jgi:hypothetical protein